MKPVASYLTKIKERYPTLLHTEAKLLAEFCRDTKIPPTVVERWDRATESLETYLEGERRALAFRRWNDSLDYRLSRGG